MNTTTPRRTSRARLLVLACAALIGLPGCALLQEIAQEQLPAATSLAPEDDYFTVAGPAELAYQPAEPGVIEYCPLDQLGRAVCAYGELTASLRHRAQGTDRQDIDVDPAGWPDHNEQLLIPALPGQDSSRDYSGWMWNRSHLVADSLGGDAIRENLVTGTRTQNVGSHQEHGQYAGGMAYTELLARDYLDAQADDSCPLYYAATPVYQGGELIPREVTVDIRTCDGSLDQHVIASNTANGWAIDYTDGHLTEEPR